jgi:hypothetical protein
MEGWRMELWDEDVKIEAKGNAYLLDARRCSTPAWSPVLTGNNKRSCLQGR